MKTHYH